MTKCRFHVSRKCRALGVMLPMVALATCRGNSTSSAPPAAVATAPATIDVARVVEQPLDVQLSLPGELGAYQTVAIYPRVTGFVKAVNVDRGTRVRAGDLLARLEAPELVAQRAEAQSKLHGAEAQLSVARSKADADNSTFDKLKAASATPGVVAGNDVAIAEKAADASSNQALAAQRSIEAARQALNAVRDMEGYLRVTAPFAGVVTERNVHPGALVGPASGAGAATPLLRLRRRRWCGSSTPIGSASSCPCLRPTRPKRNPVPRSRLPCRLTPDSASRGRSRASLRQWTSAHEPWRSNWMW